MTFAVRKDVDGCFVPRRDLVDGTGDDPGLVVLLLECKAYSERLHAPDVLVVQLYCARSVSSGGLDVTLDPQGIRGHCIGISGFVLESAAGYFMASLFLPPITRA